MLAEQWACVHYQGLLIGRNVRFHRIGKLTVYVARLQLKLEVKFNHRSRDRHLLEWYFTRVAKVSDPGVGRIRGNPSLNVADLISPDKPI